MVYCKRIFILVILFITLFSFSFLTFASSVGGDNELHTLDWAVARRFCYSEDIPLDFSKDLSIYIEDYPLPTIQDVVWSFTLNFINSSDSDNILSEFPLTGDYTLVTSSDYPSTADFCYISLDNDYNIVTTENYQLIYNALVNKFTYFYNNTNIDNSQYFRIVLDNNKFNMQGGEITSDLTFPKPVFSSSQWEQKFYFYYMIYCATGQDNYNGTNPINAEYYLLNFYSKENFPVNNLVSLYTSTNYNGQNVKQNRYGYWCFRGSLNSSSYKSNEFYYEENPYHNGQHNFWFDYYKYNKTTNTWDYLRFDYRTESVSYGYVIACNFNFYIADPVSGIRYNTCMGDVIPTLDTSIQSLSDFTFGNFVLDDRGLWLGNSFRGDFDTYSFYLGFIYSQGDNVFVPLKDGQMWNYSRNYIPIDYKSFNENTFKSTPYFRFNLLSVVNTSYQRSIVTYYGNPARTGKCTIVYILRNSNDVNLSKFFVLQDLNMSVSQSLIDTFNSMRAKDKEDILDYLGENGKDSGNESVAFFTTLRDIYNNNYLRHFMAGDLSGVELLYERIYNAFMYRDFGSITLSILGTDIFIDSNYNQYYPNALKTMLEFLWWASIGLFLVTSIRGTINTILEGDWFTLGHDVKSDLL